jgi:hypothetical protein
MKCLEKFSTSCGHFSDKLEYVCVDFSIYSTSRI